MKKKNVVMLLMLIALISMLATVVQFFKQPKNPNSSNSILKNEQIERYLLKSRLESTIQSRVFGTILVSQENDEKEWIIEISQDEHDSFNMLTYAEDGIEEEDVQVAVAATIINRVQSEYFADDFYGVMKHKNAFSSVKDGTIYLMTKNPCKITLDMVPEATKSAVKRALEGEDPTEELLRQEARRLGLDEEYYAAGGALYFYNPDACSTEALAKRENIQVKVKLGYHYYYKVWG